MSLSSFKIMGLLVWKKISKCFGHIWAWQPSWSIFINLCPPSQGGFIHNSDLIGQVVSEKRCLKIMVIYMYKALGSFFFKNINLLSMSFAASFSLLNVLITVFSIQTHRQPKFDFAVK